jgi:cytidyltransferase-like protein
MKNVVVTGSFDDLRSPGVRFLEEASRLGQVNVLLWSDETCQAHTGSLPKFPEAERAYLVQAIRYVSHVTIGDETITPSVYALPYRLDFKPDVWVVQGEAGDDPRKKAYCQAHGLEYQVIERDRLLGFPAVPIQDKDGIAARRKVVVTGCYDWFHSGHVRFFEEVSGLGDLYVVVGSDPNVRLLKGAGHPLFPQDERRYMVQSIRYVCQALVSSGQGWMDAEPEIALIKPDLYAVNEDGDKPEKRQFCLEHGIEYVVLRRAPKAGLPRRQSTDLRGY